LKPKPTFVAPTWDVADATDGFAGRFR
jgi:hypothetical protein